MTSALVNSIVEKLQDAIPDIAVAPKGEMSIYSHSKNLRIQVSNAKDVSEATYKKFEDDAERLKASTAIFISCNEEIGFDVDTAPCLLFFIHIGDLNDRFIEYLGSLPNINSSEEEEDVNEEEEEEKPKPKAKAPAKGKAKAPAKPKPEPKPKETKPEPKETKQSESFIDKYDETDEGFEQYCIDVPKSKVEFKKAQAKWSEQMKPFKTLKAFTDHVVSLKSKK